MNVEVTRILETDTKYEKIIKKLFQEISRKIKHVPTSGCRNILLIFKKEGIRTWWQIGQFIADYEVYEQDWVFSENRISGVYEIIFDDQGMQDITLNIGHPKSERGSRGLCVKTDLFSNDATYSVFRRNYFSFDIADK